MPEKWIDVHASESKAARADVVTEFLHTSDHHRSHTALEGDRPICHVNHRLGDFGEASSIA